MIKILNVNSKKLLKKFIKFPYELYKNNPYFPKPLLIEQKEIFDFNSYPFFQHAKVKLFLAINEREEVAGRIAAIINYNHNKYWNENIGFFGFFETINNFEVVSLLFKEVENWFKKEKIFIIRGPMNFSTNETCGLLINAFDQIPSIMMPYNFEYYPLLLEQYGFQKIKDLFAFRKDELDLPERIKNFVNLIKNKYNVEIKKMDFKKFEEIKEMVKYIYNKAWEKNWGFVKMTDAELDYTLNNLKLIADPDLVNFAIINNEPVGFIAILPDINEILVKCNGRLTPLALYRILTGIKKCKNIRCITMGVIEEYRSKGIDILLYYACYEGVKGKAYKYCEFSWILEDNFNIINVIRKINAYEYRRYRIYQKSIN
ncbi:MAG TPA: GNAT family N-acetyltransferase [bacterium]|nr:GNAT family N-acetyltransferase [bacterium]HOL47218.1 GNAT family N-acetyltransferase [bacterium]HPQ18273.1 GNAT family N-acetyltransferase [bacterium]